MKKFYTASLLIIALVFANISFMKAADYYLKQGSGSITQASSWGTVAAGNGSGDSPSGFSGTHTWHFTNRASVDFALGPFSIPAAATASIHSGFHCEIQRSIFKCICDRYRFRWNVDNR
jgi:hypothetical protein